nr:efflux RND transporter periplasmic adaptor subunit [Desulfobacula sp.]
MKKNRNVGIMILLGIISMVWGLLACDRPKDAPAEKAEPQAAEVSVLTLQPERAAVTTELSGRVSAFLVAEVRPQVGGIIQRVLFTEGSEVREGEVLYQIDPALFQAAYDIAAAALNKAEALLLPARAKAERYRQLIGSNAISRQDFDDADAAGKKAETDVISAKAEMERARINLAYTRVKAPISGRIGKSSVTTGALVTAFQPVALSVIQKLDPVYVDVTQSSTNLLRLKQSLDSGTLRKGAGHEAGIKLILEDGTPYAEEGLLKFADVTVDEGTGSVILRSVFPNPDLILLPGMFVRAVIEEGINENAILVPQRCVTRNAKGIPTAMVVSPENKVDIRELKIDRALENRWLIREGLAPGDRVIVEGLQKAIPGSMVKTVPFEAKP